MCDCIEKVNELLKDRNGLLEVNLLSNPLRVMVSVCRRASKGKKPPLMEASHCPFCGERYPERKRDLARDLAVRT
jgi:hypothetical protein